MIRANRFARITLQIARASNLALRSYQLQLENSPALIFISIGRCQLDAFRGTPPGFCFEVSLPLPSLSCRQVVWTGALALSLSGKGRLGMEFLHNTNPQKNPGDKCHRGQQFLQAEQSALCPQIRDFGRKCSTLSQKTFLGRVRGYEKVTSKNVTSNEKSF